MRQIAKALSVLLTVSCAMAQAPTGHGFTFNIAVGATSRGSVGANAGELIMRIDHDDYRGLDESINGYRAITQDQDGATPEFYDLFFYHEDPANPDFPNFVAGATPGAAAFGGVTGLPGPTGAAGPTAAFVSITFNTPIAAGTIGGDVFISHSVPAALWPNDGLSIQLNLGFNPNFPSPTVNTYDSRGPAAIAQNSYGLSHTPINSTLAYAGGSRQLYVDLLTDQASTVATAITAQTSYPISNAAPGTASFFSGLHPDVPGRLDDLGIVHFDGSLPTGSLVIFGVDLDFFATPLPMSVYVPGSTGTACLSTQLIVLGFQVWNGGSAQHVMSIPAASRPLFSGNSFVFTSIGFDTTNSVLHGGSCVKQSY